MAQPGPNDPSTAYPSYNQEVGGAGGGGVPSLNVELPEGNDNPVLSFDDSGQRTRVYLSVTGTAGEGTPADTGLRLTAVPATAKLTATDTGSGFVAQSLVNVEDNDGNTVSTVTSYAGSTKGYLRVYSATGQTDAAVHVLAASDGEPKVSIFPSGDVESHVVGAGFILASPDGTRYRITVADGGALSAVAA